MFRLKIIIVTAAVALVGVAAILGFRYAFAPAYEGQAGIAYGSAFVSERNQNIKFDIWYPAMPGGRSVTVGGNGVFFGTEAGLNAPRRPGRFPMILISHGAGGNAGQFGWIASKLAANGFVVVLPNHPGSTSGNASAQEAVKIWKRPVDLSAVIDEIENNLQEFDYIDTTRIAALGFSAGGYTAMAVSGAIADPIKLTHFCDGAETGMSDCQFLANGGVDLHKMDLSPAGQDLRDKRIVTSIIIDPGIVGTLTSASLRAIDLPMMIINLGLEQNIPPAIYARVASEMIPNAKYVIVEDAIHFSFLAECKERGPKILQDEGEIDPLCEDAGGRTRTQIQDELSILILEYLN